jgi:hypothetical protein
MNRIEILGGEFGTKLFMVWAMVIHTFNEMIHFQPQKSGWAYDQRSKL